MKSNTLLNTIKTNKIMNKSIDKLPAESTKSKGIPVNLPSISNKNIIATTANSINKISKHIKENNMLRESKHEIKNLKDLPKENNLRSSRSIESRIDSRNELSKRKISVANFHGERNQSPKQSFELRMGSPTRVSPFKSTPNAKSHSDLKKVPNKEKCFYYIIVPGNNSLLVKNSMAHRTNWRECSSSATSMFNFKWQQSSIGVDFNNFNRVSSIKQVNTFIIRLLIISKVIQTFPTN